MSDSDITVIVPAYNAQETLSDTIESLLNQTDSEWKCIIVNDGSEDRTLEIACDFAQKDQRFTVISKENGGTASAYNAGVLQAKTTYVAICSADDILDEKWNQFQKKMIMEHPDFSIFCTNGWYLFHDSNQIREVYSSNNWSKEKELSLREVVRRCFFSVGCVYRRTMFEQLGGYRVAVYGEDYDLWLRGMTNGAKVFYCPIKLSYHRISGFQKTNNTKKVISSAYEVINYSLKQDNVTPKLKREITRGLRMRKLDSFFERIINRVKRLI